MIQKYFFIAIILVGTLLVSCRQEDEVDASERVESTNLLIEKSLGRNKSQNKSGKSDSLYFEVEPNNPSWARDTIIGIEENDPPKNGTHWKTGK